jgi:hypothetical protein
VSCRLLTSASPHTTRASSLGDPPPVLRPGHGDATSPFLHRGHGLGAYLSTSLGPGRQKGHVPLYTTVWASGLPWSRPSAHAPARAYRLLLPRRDSLPTRLPQRDRPGCNASPQDREFTPSGSLAGPVTVRGPCPAQARIGFPSPPAAARLLAHPSPATGPAWLQRIPPGPRIHTVRLPRGTGHGKGPCPAQARIGFPKSSWSRPQRASTVHRSRQTAPEPCLTRPPADSTHGRHKARCALQSIPSVQCPGEGP